MDYRRLSEGLACCLQAEADRCCPVECPYHAAEDGGILARPECRRALQRDALRASRLCERLVMCLEALSEEAEARP